LLSKEKDQSLFFPTSNNHPEFFTLKIEDRRNFNKLLTKYPKSMKIVSCWHSIDLILECLEKVEYMEIVVGDSLVTGYKKQLHQKLNEFEKLYQLQKEGRFKIFVTSEKQIHSKLYIFENDNEIVALNGSLNFTKSGIEAKHQKNYLWGKKFTKGVKYDDLNKIQEDYEWHKSMCYPFFGDYEELIVKNPEVDRKDLAVQFLEADLITDEHEMNVAISDMTKDILSGDIDLDVPYLVKLNPALGNDRFKKMESILSKFGGTRLDDGISIEPRGFLNHKETSYPMMDIDMEKEMVAVGLFGEKKLLTQDSYTSKEINSFLEHIESYIQTAKLSKNQDDNIAMLSMYEALLYILWSPFADEYHKKKRIVIGSTANKTGPKILHLHGPSSNGKTHFFIFASKLLTGELIDSIPGDKLAIKHVQGFLTYKSNYPIMYDDLPSGKWGKGKPTDLIKSYWDSWYDPKFSHPQLIVSSNDRCPNGPVKRRITEIEFAMMFKETPANEKIFNDLLEYDNPIFKIFSKKFMIKLKKATVNDFSEQLNITKMCFKELYEEANRQLPNFFPSESLESYVDSGRRKWKELIERDGKAQIKKKGDIVQVKFDEDMSLNQGRWDSVDEVANYISCLPNDIMTSRNGNLLTIESAEDFLEWYGPITRIGKFKRWITGG